VIPAPRRRPRAPRGDAAGSLRRWALHPPEGWRRWYSVQRKFGGAQWL